MSEGMSEGAVVLDATGMSDGTSEGRSDDDMAVGAISGAAPTMATGTPETSDLTGTGMSS